MHMSAPICRQCEHAPPPHWLLWLPRATSTMRGGASRLADNLCGLERRCTRPASVRGGSTTQTACGAQLLNALRWYRVVAPPPPPPSVHGPCPPKVGGGRCVGVLVCGSGHLIYGFFQCIGQWASAPCLLHSANKHDDTAGAGKYMRGNTDEGRPQFHPRQPAIYGGAPRAGSSFCAP